MELIPRYSTNRDFRPTNTLAELEARGLYTPVGSWQSASREHIQTVDTYIETIHSRNGFSRDRMTAAAAAAFDSGVRAKLLEHGHLDTISNRVFSTAAWGIPIDPNG